MEGFIVQNRPTEGNGDLEMEDEVGGRGPDRNRSNQLSTSITVQQLRMAEEIFGENMHPLENEESKQEKIGQVSQEPKLQDIYEPKEIQQKYATEFDQKIKQTDLPERMQLALKDMPVPTKKFQAEANWIWKQRKEKDNKEMIKNILEAYRKEHYEAPFIYTYRKHLYKQALEKKDVWEICSLDKKWSYFIEMKKSLQSRLIPIQETFKQFGFINEELEKTESMTELEDIKEFVEFYRILLKAGQGQGVTEKTKLTRRQKEISQLVQQRIPELVGKLMLHPWELAENLKAMHLLKTPPDAKVRATLLAKDYISEQGKELLTEANVFFAALRFASEEMSVLPAIRKLVRDYYMTNAVVSTLPTPKGIVELDVFHHSYRVKHIVKRPIATFQDDLWLDIKYNEGKNFITVQIGLENYKLANLLAQISQCFLNEDSENDEILKEYNAVRKETLEKCLRSYLLPAAEQNARKELVRKAEEFVIEKCCEQFRGQIMAGPYRTTADTKYEDNNPLESNQTEEQAPSEEGVKVLSFVVDIEAEKKAVVQMAMVNENGELIEHKLLHNITCKNTETMNASEKSLFDHEAEECKKCMREHEPDLIVVGANRLEAQSLKKLLREWAEQEHRIDDNDDNIPGKGPAKKKEAWVTWGDLTIPKIYSASEISTKQLPEASPLLRMAISQARLKQDALSEILNLWSQDGNANGIFSMALHPLQRLVNSKALENALEQVAVECVNDVGVDINRIIEHPHLEKTLSFVCGFGPRKAQDVIVTLKKKGRLDVRVELLGKQLTGAILYKNCIGFIKVKNTSEEGDVRDPLDQTRMHPENYFIARKIASEALMGDKKQK